MAVILSKGDIVEIAAGIYLSRTEEFFGSELGQYVGNRSSKARVVQGAVQPQALHASQTQGSRTPADALPDCRGKVKMGGVRVAGQQVSGCRQWCCQALCYHLAILYLASHADSHHFIRREVNAYLHSLWRTERWDLLSLIESTTLRA